jgi:extradiol dioxygenase family protein
VADHTVHLSIAVDDLDSARDFYTNAMGCRLGRVRDAWLDVWFFGMQLTLQHRPEEVRPLDEQGVRHFGVVLDHEADYLALLARLEQHGVTWIAHPRLHEAQELSGKSGAKVADPSGNVIEIKWYADPTEYLG